MIQATGTGGSIAFVRETLGRVTEEIQTGPDGTARSVKSTYDPLGQRARLDLSNGQSVETTYDPRGLPSALRLFDDSTLAAPLLFEHDARGREIQRHSPRGFILRQSWDATDQLTTQSAGRLTGAGLPDLRAPTAPQPDAASPVVAATVTRFYGWDKAFNPTRISDSRWGESRLSYDPNGQITSARHGWGEERFAYDARGRVVEKRHKRAGFRPQTWRYQWDDDDQLRTLTEPDGTLWRYDTDPLGRRTRKLSARGGTAYVWDGDSLTQEIPLAADGSVAPAAEATLWTYGPDGFTPLARFSAGQVWYAVTDHLGTPRELLTEGGQLAWAAQLRAWGLIANDLRPSPVAEAGSTAAPDYNLRF